MVLLPLFFSLPGCVKYSNNNVLGLGTRQARLLLQLEYCCTPTGHLRALHVRLSLCLLHVKMKIAAVTTLPFGVFGSHGAVNLSQICRVSC